MTWPEVFDELGLTIVSRQLLLAVGGHSRMLTSAVRVGALIRVRRDHYALPGTDQKILRAVRVGGRLACASALRNDGLFGFDDTNTHVHLEREASRLRSPQSRQIPLRINNRAGDVLHWSPLRQPEACNEFRVGVVDALAQTLRCNHPWHALASIENALHLGKIRDRDLRDVFEGAPESLQYLRGQVDSRSEAGQETVLRSALHAAGIESQIQVEIAGVGRVDGVVEGRLIWECDSRLAHDGWELHVRDRDRDINAARQGYMTLRPAYNRTMFATSEVVDAVVQLLSATRRFRQWA